MSLEVKNWEEYTGHYDQSIKDREQYWSNVASQFLWHKRPSLIQSGSMSGGDVKWFEDGKLNITENCLDRHLLHSPDKVALTFVSNDPKAKKIEYTYKELHQEVCKTANMLKSFGISKGDRVCLYMGMTPELMFSVLACARIGAIHSVVFGGFSAQALADRIIDAQAKALIVSDGSLRGNKVIDLKSIVDQSLLISGTECLETVIVHKRANLDLSLNSIDRWWHEHQPMQSEKCPAEIMNAEDPLFILYTSGSTGKPKGIVHTTAGYMVWAQYTFENVFQVKQDDVYWCTADIGWITGHTYITYGPLLSGKNTVMFEGVPTFPDASRFWTICDDLKVTHFYTAPTAIRALMSCGDQFVETSDLSSLKVIGSVGEPINEEAWHWYDKKVGKGKCPIVDTWWQTETGGILISPLAGITETIPCHATKPLPGIEPVLVDDKAKELTETKAQGNLCIKSPWPGMLRTIWNDHNRFMETYMKPYPGYYFTGDGCKRCEKGNYRITGRVDDVINVSGHRVGTAEVEDAINQNNAVVESAVVGKSHPIKGQCIYAFVILNEKTGVSEDDIKATVVKHIGALARPETVMIVSDLPKTRSGKIMRRILRKLSEGEFDELGDVSTLLNPDVVQQIRHSLN